MPRDIYQIPRQALAERIKRAGAVITCCATNVDYLKTATAAAQHAKLRVIHNGINLSEFHPAPGESDAAAPLILSASRLAEKKGYPDLLHACQVLVQMGYAFRCVIYGSGPLQAELGGPGHTAGAGRARDAGRRLHAGGTAGGDAPGRHLCLDAVRHRGRRP